MGNAIWFDSNSTIVWQNVLNHLVWHWWNRFYCISIMKGEMANLDGLWNQTGSFWWRKKQCFDRMHVCTRSNEPMIIQRISTKCSNYPPTEYRLIWISSDSRRQKFHIISTTTVHLLTEWAARSEHHVHKYEELERKRGKGGGGESEGERVRVREFAKSIKYTFAV